LHISFFFHWKTTLTQPIPFPCMLWPSFRRERHPLFLPMQNSILGTHGIVFSLLTLVTDPNAETPAFSVALEIPGFFLFLSIWIAQAPSGFPHHSSFPYRFFKRCFDKLICVFCKAPRRRSHKQFPVFLGSVFLVLWD